MSDARSIARDQLRAFIERIERLEEEKKTVADDIKDVKAEARAIGFDVKAINEIIKLRKKDENERAEEEAILDVYKAALGMIPDLFAESEDQPEPAAPTRKPSMAPQSPRQAAEGCGWPAISEPSGTEGKSAAATNKERRGVLGVTDRRDDRLNSQSEDDAIAAVNARDGLADANGVEPSSSETSKTPSVDSEETGTDAEDTRSDANTGGDDVDDILSAAPHQAGALVKPAPATPGQIVFEHTPRVPMHRFAFAHCWPELTKAEYGALEAEISNDPCGVIEPIVRKGDVILDGWARYNIARSFGDEYPIIEYDGEDELLDVIHWQRTARNWSPEQERKIASALAKEVPHRASEIMSAFEIEGEAA